MHDLPQPFTRRQFLKAGSAAAALCALPLSFSLAAETASRRAGLQLYTLRDWMQVSVPGTLKLVAGVGYKELEFAGYFDQSPKQIRKLLDDEGLSAPSAHVPLTTFQESVNKVIDTAQAIGHKYVVVPYLTPEQRGSSIDVYKKLADDMQRWGEACKRADITLAYHNHDFEFQRVDGELPYDILLNNTDPKAVSFELDLYWTVKAGVDPVQLFNQHPGRFKLFHVKDMDKKGEFADVGTGTIDFGAIFKHADKAGLAHQFVERDQTQDKLATIQQGYKALTQILRQR
ncbi:sugar phosphate isomerase/epimerase [Salinimonas sp. HHU 13199]|uniref:Sugar phosphate isomerase/epimerase n=1 Tax=Salinimonas profundi TaxID=2729140 RepID=A0ABR8LPR2_9ALTE|nr:sugar phosphate isomerase/epimerase [Salinimonas profundi]MBD3586392.1 sugar phosphate isomerase/epimerase [Salinimonas profundi]